MSTNWLEFAQKMAQAARAGVAVEREKLREILAKRQRQEHQQQSIQHSR
jgi:hypothetical protein